MTTMDRIAAAMGCAPADDDDLVEAVRLLVSERDEARADRARLLAYVSDATDDAVGLIESVHRAVATHQGVLRERDAARALADGLRVEFAAALEAVAAERDRLRVDLEATERARYAAEEERDTVLELVADDAVEAARARDDRDAARLHAVATLRVALADAELILEQRERQLTEAVEAVAAERARREAAEATATRSADAAVDAVRELGHVAAAAVARADAAEARLAALAAAVRQERAVTAEHENAWAAHITADDLAGAEEVLALDARLAAARAALDAALGAT